MYEMYGYIVWYNLKTHKWDVKRDGELVFEASGFKKAKEYCKNSKVVE